MLKSGRAIVDGHQARRRLQGRSDSASLFAGPLRMLRIGAFALAGLLLSPSTSSCSPPKEVLPEISQGQAPIAFAGKVIDVVDVAPTEANPRVRPYSIATVAALSRAAGDMPDTLHVLQRNVVWWSRGRLKVVVHDADCVLFVGDQIAVVATPSPPGERFPWNAVGPVWIPDYLRIILESADDADQGLYGVTIGPTGETEPGPEAVGRPVRTFIQRHYEPVGISLSEFLQSCEAQYSR